jgi:hypothetical protein
MKADTSRYSLIQKGTNLDYILLIEADRNLTAGYFFSNRRIVNGIFVSGLSTS